MQIETWPIDRVKPYPNNPRVNKDAVAAVAVSLKEFGWRQPIVVDSDGVIIVGHTRWKAAKQLGFDQVPIHVATDLTPEQIKAYRIADNQTATIAEWDKQLLPIELADLKAMNYDLGLLGFEPDELQKWMGAEAAEGLCDPDEVPAPPDAAVTQAGNLWTLGNHRLLCGDSSQPDQLDRLINGAEMRCGNLERRISFSTFRYFTWRASSFCVAPAITSQRD
ncbi:ParB N-terminal domain-containing protein [Anatilimnocola floriformis]|uniref:ParB N-terminal domain-containing protein n=1 Tax=Anatilimnocola floriformis TaxID=2948575 RepID=UPI0020C257DC|nr:ParB N-terminal domain-containing protein [Anatilimnocola floriformis]